ncbi:hypothetical protein pb186bvf_003656 [Paramecium bursaria]
MLKKSLIYDYPSTEISQNMSYQSDNLIFSNISPLLEFINQSKDHIQNQDLVSYLNPKLDPYIIIDQVDKLQKFWIMKQDQDREKSVISNSINFVYKSLLMKNLFQLTILNTLKKICSLTAIYFLDLTTDEIKIYEQDSHNIGKPILYLGGMTIIYFIGTMFDSLFSIVENKFLTKLKIITQYLIYQKAIRTKYIQETQQNQQTQEQSANINNLLTVDIEQLNGIRWGVIELSNSIFMISVIVYMLYLKLGDTIYKGLIFLLIAIIINMVISIVTIYFFQIALVHKDKRISLAQDVIDGIKQLKYLSWEKVFNDKILFHRKNEFRFLSYQKIVDTFSLVFWSSISYILLYIFIVEFINNGKTFQSTNIFTCIALFNLLTFPMTSIPYCVSALISMRVSFGRISKFLDQPTINQNDIEKNSYQNDSPYTIEFPKSTFQWVTLNNLDADSNFQLHIPEHKIFKNSLNIIVGKIGSGKSSFLNIILNELEQSQQIMSQQKIKINGTLAYVSQNHWLQNKSVRDNILMGKDFNQEFYEVCIKVSQLAQDINQFPGNDQFLLGPDAKNISGGQKQRICIARALYQDCDIYLLDDVFSSLDIQVADKIFQKTIQDQLMSKGKTVIVVTSQFRLIEMSKNPTLILIENGNVITDTTMIQKFIQQESNDNMQSSFFEEPTRQPNRHHLSTQFLVQPQEVFENNAEEEREIGEIKQETVNYWLQSMTWPVLYGFLLSGLLVIFSRNFIDFWLRAEITPGNESFNFLNDIFGYDFETKFTDLIWINFSVTVVQSSLMSVCTLLSGWKIYKKLQQVVMNSKMQFFDNNQSGKIINRLSNDTLDIDYNLPWYAGVFLNSLLQCIGYPLGLVILFPWMILVIIAELYIFWVMQRKFRKSNRDIKRIQSSNEGENIGYLSETTSGLRIIRAFERQQFFIEQYINKLRHSINSLGISNKITYWINVRLQLLSNGIFFTVALSLSIMLLFQMDVNYSTSAMTLTYAVLVANIFNEAMKWYILTESKIICVERVMQYHKNPQEDNKHVIIEEVQRQKVLKDIPSTQEEIKINDDDIIVFHNVTLTYDQIHEQSKEMKYALKNFTLKIKKGEKIAFVGRTGSGKTSILNILFRLYDFQAGSLFIQGQDIQKLDLHQVRNMMSIVPQFGFLYNATLKENIDPLNLIPSKQIEEIFNQTGFRIKGIIEQNIHANELNITGSNLDFIIAKSGSNLSNGEKQVINFLRIILQNKQIVCLDEATSNMDPITDEKIKPLLSQLTDWKKSKCLIEQQLWKKARLQKQELIRN